MKQMKKKTKIKTKKERKELLNMLGWKDKGKMKLKRSILTSV